MTQFSDALRQGDAFFEGAQKWNAPTALSGLPFATSPQDTQNRGVPHTQQFVYQIGTASTPLATGVVYTTASQGGSLTATGPLVTASVATFDVPRAARISASTNLATVLVTIRGTDGYGQALTWTGIGPSGNTLGNTGSYVDTTQAFKTITTASIVGLASAGIQVGSASAFGLPYLLPNVGYALDLYINGSSASVPATFVAGFTPTGTPTASGADVRGLVTLATTSLPDGSKYFSVLVVTPNVGTTVNTDNRVNSFGAVPFSS